MKVALKLAVMRFCGFLATIPFRFKGHDVSPPNSVSHGTWIEYLSKTFNRKGLRVLEIGSRNVTGANLRRHFPETDYVGFDVLAGENVDVVGDAHRLSSYFTGQEKFDLIVSTAVFEHLRLPWVVAVEIQKLLKPGGYVFVETHFSFSAHDRPWHFFQFSDMGLRALFHEDLGFEVIESGMSNPISGYFSLAADGYLRYLPVTELYCHSEILCRKRTEVAAFDWGAASTDVVVDGTQQPYPNLRPSSARPAVR